MYCHILCHNTHLNKQLQIGPESHAVHLDQDCLLDIMNIDYNAENKCYSRDAHS